MIHIFKQKKLEPNEGHKILRKIFHDSHLALVNSIQTFNQIKEQAEYPKRYIQLENSLAKLKAVFDLNKEAQVVNKQTQINLNTLCEIVRQQLHKKDTKHLKYYSFSDQYCLQVFIKANVKELCDALSEYIIFMSQQASEKHIRVGFKTTIINEANLLTISMPFKRDDDAIERLIAKPKCKKILKTLKENNATTTITNHELNNNEIIFKAAFSKQT